MEDSSNKTSKITTNKQKQAQKPTDKPTLNKKPTIKRKLHQYTPYNIVQQLIKPFKKPKLEQSTSPFPTSIPLKDDIGKLGLMWPRGTIANSHPAAPMLHKFSNSGCPVDTGENWTIDMIKTALKKGPHISAKEEHAKEYLIKETNMKIKRL